MFGYLLYFFNIVTLSTVLFGFPIPVPDKVDLDGSALSSLAPSDEIVDDGSSSRPKARKIAHIVALTFARIRAQVLRPVSAASSQAHPHGPRSPMKIISLALLGVGLCAFVTFLVYHSNFGVNVRHRRAARSSTNGRRSSSHELGNTLRQSPHPENCSLPGPPPYTPAPPAYTPAVIPEEHVPIYDEPLDMDDDHNQAVASHGHPAIAPFSIVPAPACAQVPILDPTNITATHPVGSTTEADDAITTSADISATAAGNTSVAMHDHSANSARASVAASVLEPLASFEKVRHGSLPIPGELRPRLRTSTDPNCRMTALLPQTSGAALFPHYTLLLS